MDHCSHHEFVAERDRDVSIRTLLPKYRYRNELNPLFSFSHLDKSVGVFKYYGKGRDADIREYLDREIVLTTYHTIAASMNRSNSIIFHIEWFRVVLDEGRCQVVV